ncbi:MAG: T9SS type A sorting domain-containing protein [Bacteroidota bacterium]
MRKVLLIVISVLFYSQAWADYWVQKADVGGVTRGDATGFTLGGKCYMGTGYNASTYLSDWWEYDPAADTWTQKASHPGNGIVEAASFTIGPFGYVVSAPLSNDVYSYDPATNTWTAVASFPGGSRQAAVSFSINNKGYVCTGMGLGFSYNDLWEYDPVLDTWSQKSSMPTGGRHYACGFALGGKAYVGTGLIPGGGLTNDFWEWDPSTDTWTSKGLVPGFARVEATAFSMNGFGYLGMGSSFGLYYSDFYQYNPNTNTWAIKATYGGGPTEEATQFSLGSVGYVGTGYDGQSPGVLKNDFWAYLSEDSTTNVDELNIQLDAKIFPNPCVNTLQIELETHTFKHVDFELLDAQGRLVRSGRIIGQSQTLNISGVAQGRYILRLTLPNAKQITYPVTKS